MTRMKTTLKAFGTGLVVQWALFTTFVIASFHEVLLEHGGFWMSWVATSLVLAGSFTAVRIGTEATGRWLKVAATTKAYYRAIAPLFALCLLASFLGIITSTALFHIQGDRRDIPSDIGLLANSFSLVTLVVLYPACALGRLMVIHPCPVKKSSGIQPPPIHPRAQPTKPLRPPAEENQQKQ